MEWYIPITILPGIGFLILSTSNFLISLNDEIRELELEKEKYRQVILEKLDQLKKLNYALISQYISSFFLVLGGITSELLNNKEIMKYLVFSGILCLSIAIGLMIMYSIKSLHIRQKHLKI